MPKTNNAINLYTNLSNENLMGAYTNNTKYDNVLFPSSSIKFVISGIKYSPQPSPVK